MALGELLAGIGTRNVAALARAITLVENGREGYEALLSAIHADLGRAHRIGVTGPPGGGKSTLAERLIQAYRRRGFTVAVVAVDPTSPFSGGALLGDRIRMESASLDPNVFIRSMATRGATGGLATTTREVCDVLDAYGFQRIIIETVGVGQSELAIAASADSAALVLVPESGDGVQALKAGIMEIADLFIVNKADRPGADRLKQEVEIMLGIRRGNAFRHVAPHHGRSKVTAGTRPERPTASPAPPLRPLPPEGEGAVGTWEPPVFLTVASKGEGVEEVVDAVERHAAFLAASGELARRRRVRLERLTREVVDRTLRQLVWDGGRADATLAAGLEDVVRGDISPYELAQEIVAGVAKGTNHGG
ncbi:MAG: methylmalonyl Co-A mutase-associated GTPase MeaB [Gemmatimonadetes bacterium]|nr:methylmalonyl Co-A mutase-associated GTPase MeaB [Gemmatimonadota bacterium]